MPKKFYDVIVIGRSLGALAAAALLARRDFTVLVVGNGRPPARYGLAGFQLARRSFTMLAGTSPVWLRLIRELAHTQAWRRVARVVDPMLQLMLPDGRLDLPLDGERFAREIEREVGDVRRLIAALYEDMARVGALADTCFAADAIWPPASFFERRETMRHVSRVPYARAEPHADLLADFPRGHIYRRVVAESVRFATDLAGTPPAFATVRLHASWTRDLCGLDGGEDELDALLCDRIRANGGELLLNGRVARLEVRGKTVTGALLDGDDVAFQAGHVVTDLRGEEVVALSRGEGIQQSAQRDWPRVLPSTGRFVTSLIVRRQGVPAPLGKEALLIPREHATGLDARAIHLQRLGTAGPEHELLVAELLIGEREAATLFDVRRHILERIARELPQHKRHLAWVDSPHDGLPAWRFDEGKLSEVERTTLGLAACAEPMIRQLEVDPPGFLGIAGEPLRGPIDRTLLVGPSVLPALGQEGALLAASSAARLITRSDRRKARMRRETWTKLEVE
ncbi:MAG: phytoene dehydrogenase [Myxococcales bacterium]|nr:phytoene dehydrogenase [Myxococcales bacterium]